jgi:hypothetical protein
VLVVVQVREDGERIRQHPEGTLALCEAYWVSLEGKPASSNGTTQVVHVPAGNKVDEEGLMRMLETCGVRSSAFVPEYRAWGDK